MRIGCSVAIGPSCDVYRLDGTVLPGPSTQGCDHVCPTGALCTVKRDGDAMSDNTHASTRCVTKIAARCPRRWTSADEVKEPER